MKKNKTKQNQALCFTDRIVYLQYTQIQDKYLSHSIHLGCSLMGCSLSLLFLLLLFVVVFT